jgi:hypothetical protein
MEWKILVSQKVFLYFVLELRAISALGFTLDNRHESSVFKGLKLRPAEGTVRYCCCLNKSCSQNCIFDIDPEAYDNLNGARKAQCLQLVNKLVVLYETWKFTTALTIYNTLQLIHFVWDPLKYYAHVWIMLPVWKLIITYLTFIGPCTATFL